MNDPHDSQTFRDLEPALLAAVQAVLADPPPENAILRVLDRAKQLDARVSGTPRMAQGTVTKAPTRSSKSLLAWCVSGATAIAATVLLALFLVSSSANVSFAEILAAVSRQPWVHGTTTYSDGQRSVTWESWVSTEQRLAAMKLGDRRQFEDIETGVSLQYNAKDGTIYRVPSQNAKEGRFTAAHLPGLLDRLIADPADARDLFEGERVVKAERHEEKLEGKPWLEYLIHLERIGNPAIQRTVRIRLDVATQLPALWEERKGDGSVAVTRFDYPDSGPESIYDLGVPQTAKLIDRVPQGDLARIVAAQRAGRKRFDAYDAMVVQQMEGATTNYEHLQNLSVKRVRRKGNQYRVDQLLIAKEGLVAPGPETDMQQWWKENRELYWSVPQLICDGETTYFYTMLANRIAPGKKPNLAVVEKSRAPVRFPSDDSPVEWPQLMPEQCSRPHLWPSDKAREFAVDAAANDGPQGSVRVIVTTKAEPRAGELFRYWFDPNRDDVLRKEVFPVFDQRTNKVAYIDTQQYDEFAQSPTGKWYPQIVRRTTSDNPQWEGVTRFFVDFESDLSAELFRAVTE